MGAPIDAGDADTAETAARRAARLTLAVQLGAFVLVLGIPDGSLGVLWPSMRATFHLPLDDLGLLTIASTVLYIGGGLAGHAIRRRLGVAGSMVASCALGAGMLGVWAAAPVWALLLAAVALLGLSRGVIDAVINADAALDGGVQRLGIIHGSWAIGGAIGPILVAFVLALTGDWRVAVGITAVATAALVPLAVLDSRSTARAAGAPLPGAAPPAAPPTEAPLPAAAPPAAPPTEAPLPGAAPPAAPPTEAPLPGAAPPFHPPTVSHRQLLAVLTVVAFVAYTAAECGPIAWGFTYLIDDRHVSRAAGAVAMAGFWVALTVGRFGLAAIEQRISATAILEGSCLLMMLGTALFWLLPGSFDVVGLPIAGLGSAAVFPLLMALTPERVGEDKTGHTVGAAIAAAGIGGPLAIATAGVVAADYGVRYLAVCLCLATAVMYTTNRVLTHVTRRLVVDG